MRKLIVFMVCTLLATSFVSSMVSANDIFPEFHLSVTRLYIPITQILTPYEDLEHEIGFNFSYTVNCQIIAGLSDGHIQTISEGFSGTSDRSTPWKTLTELLAAYQSCRI